MEDHALTTYGLIKEYGKGFRALGGLCMNVPVGAIYGLVGKNGSGKTTLIRTVCGLQNPTGGSYSLFGAEYGSGEIAAARKRIGAVIETPALYSWLTAEQNLVQQCKLLGVPSSDMVGGLLKTVGLENTGKKKVKNFSLGMKQRLGIAVALCGSPDLVILDEPINGLDPQGIVEVRELILKLNRENGITFIISSHILDELSKLATHYGIIDGGRMIKELDADTLAASCRKRVSVTVTDVKPLVRYLDRIGAEYEIDGDTTASIFGDIDVTELVKGLEKQGGKLLSLRENDETLEGFYIKTVGDNNV